MTPRPPAGRTTGPGLRPARMWIVILPANLAGALAVFLYFSYVDPLGARRPVSISKHALITWTPYLEHEWLLATSAVAMRRG